MVSNERGFTLIELLYVVSIMGIMASTMWGFFSIYKDDASYSTAEASLKQARVALEIGDAEAPVGTTVGYTQTGTGGGPVVGVLANVMPGYNLTPEIRMGVQYRKCTGPGDLGLSQFIVAEACQSTKQARFIRWCDGLETMIAEVPQAKGCP